MKNYEKLLSKSNHYYQNIPDKYKTEYKNLFLSNPQEKLNEYLLNGGKNKKYKKAIEQFELELQYFYLLQFYNKKKCKIPIQLLEEKFSVKNMDVIKKNKIEQTQKDLNFIKTSLHNIIKINNENKQTINVSIDDLINNNILKKFSLFYYNKILVIVNEINEMLNKINITDENDNNHNFFKILEKEKSNYKILSMVSFSLNKIIKELNKNDEYINSYNSKNLAKIIVQNINTIKKTLENEKKI